MSEQFTFFNHIEGFTSKKSDFDPTNDLHKRSYVPYMINRIVSAVEVLVPIVNEINVNGGDIPHQTQYLYYKAILPKRKLYYNYAEIKSFVDGDKDTKEKLMEYFECSKKDCERMMRIMTREQIEKIVSIYRQNNRKINTSKE
jgi:hypothetical protein